jgi:phosphoglycerol transferase MdoB-like AlkP superfamily enzyme
MKEKPKIVISSFEQMEQDQINYSRSLSPLQRFEQLEELRNRFLLLRKDKPPQQRLEISGWIKKKDESLGDFFRRANKEKYDF